MCYIIKSSRRRVGSGGGGVGGVLEELILSVWGEFWVIFISEIIYMSVCTVYTYLGKVISWKYTDFKFQRWSTAHLYIRKH
jgi:hypothetical protein